MKAALGAEDVVCADETPTNVISKNTDEHGRPVPGSPHARATPGYLVRDDYALVSARNHGIQAIDAIHHALTGNPWLPTVSTA